MSLRWPTPASNTFGWRSSRGESSSPSGVHSISSGLMRPSAHRRPRHAGGVVHADGDAAEVAGRRAAVDPARRPRRNRPRTRQPPALLFQLRRLPRGDSSGSSSGSPSDTPTRRTSPAGRRTTSSAVTRPSGVTATIVPTRSERGSRTGTVILTDSTRRGERVLEPAVRLLRRNRSAWADPAEHHPSRLLAYARFSSDSVVEYNRLHADLIREADPDWFVTHNFMGRFPTLNAYDVSEDLDRVAWDSYPTGFVQDRYDGRHPRTSCEPATPTRSGWITTSTGARSTGRSG